jgi:polyhydroxyalkanoate synthesis regulator phasin
MIRYNPYQNCYLPDFMSNSVIRAFFIGRATADLLRERVENALADVASQLGKGLVEVQEGWRTFADDVMTRAEQERQAVATDLGYSPGEMEDLQATLDDLRAEVAQLRSELKKYRSRST